MSACAVPGDASLRWLSGLGVLTCEISPGLVDEVIEAAGAREQRRRLLPARAVVYFVLGLCLLSGSDSAGPPGYRSVMRSLTNGIRHLHGLPLPTSGALTRARQRLGEKPLQLLFEACRGPVAAAGTPGAFAFGRRLVAWDGTTLETAGSAANAAAFGTARGGPQLRLVALAECGTRAVIDAAFGAAATVSELALARQVLASLRPGMLLLADRNFPGHELWGLAAATGADLAWRIKKSLILPPLRVLPDGSYLAILRTPAENARHARARAARKALPGIPEGHLVRVVTWTVTAATAAGVTRPETFRLITTLLDSRQAPAARVAAIYRERWESESCNLELKTRLRGAGFTLRSRSPELACQETWALLIVSHALSALRADAAATAGTDPDRVSFTATLRIARDHAASHAAPAAPALARRHAIRDILADLLPPARRTRRYERITRPPRSPYPPRTRTHHRPPAKITYTITPAPPP
jgi:Insertion element 4 transposase N-terminal/Transposase DDE domain